MLDDFGVKLIVRNRSHVSAPTFLIELLQCFFSGISSVPCIDMKSLKEDHTLKFRTSKV